MSGVPLSNIPPPLPPGWTEHIAPGGQRYYHNAITKESTYIRPLPPIPGQSTLPIAKEKPAFKRPIPGTDWIRVTTTANSVFYTNKVKKESVWGVPEEIKDAVEALEREEAERVRAAKEEEEKQVEMVKKDVEGILAKRKGSPVTESVEEVISKKARVEDAVEEEEEDDDDDDESDEEDWQKEAAAQLAAEAEEEERKRRELEEAKRVEEEELKRREQEKGIPALNMPARVELSLEEAKALFKTLLREKDINPLLPWDTSLPLFVTDPRYVLLPSVTARREAFDEYCRDRIREQRQAKLAASAAKGDASSNAQAQAEDPKAVFDRLLREEATSTRTSWTDWRRKWKKDRRFYGWGRDDREREKRFREWLKELGEQKRAAAQKAEADFFALLKESGHVTLGSVWKEVKRKLDKDPRYDAVGSSSLREELFNTYLKTLSRNEPKSSSSPHREAGEITNEDWRKSQKADGDTTSSKERKERAIREREAKVREERSRLEAEAARSRGALSREEGELVFRTLLTDAIREPMATWDSSLPQLSTDPRFVNSTLPHRQQQHLFNAHVAKLRQKHIEALHALFLAHTPNLAIRFSSLPHESLLSSLPAQKLGYGTHRDGLNLIEREFREWQSARYDAARKAFDEMLGENAFVEFWGRVQKIGGEGIDGGVKADEADDPEEGEGGGGTADLKALAKSIDVKEIERVLKNDSRYAAFDHVPEERERWIRDHMTKLAAPELSVHLRKPT